MMNPDTYTFTGDAVTFLGLVGVVSAFVIVVTAFRRFFNSPYNVRYTKPTVNDESTVKDGMMPWGHSDLEYLIQNNITEVSNDTES
jgi:hypothetical protein